MTDVSANSRRIARNTLLLYGRMLLMMCIGLFTSRVVLQALGVEDFGVYGAVGGIVTMFTLFTASISQSISRYITVGLGAGDPERLKRVFSSAVLMQLLFCGLVLLLTETLGLWWLNHRMNLPEGRLEAARLVLQCAMGSLMLNLLSVPFNATIIAHEKMDAFAWISILEALLKLASALLLQVAPYDKLVSYAVLMLAVSFLIRLCYGLYCRHAFAESRGKPVFDGTLLKEMTGFAGWNVLGSGCYLFNTQGINQLSNIYFGVGVNAARAIAVQVEGIVKQFASNFLLALNPQLTKSYAAGDRTYATELVEKGVKFTFLLILLFLLPIGFEAPALLGLWLGSVPPYAASFVRLTMLFLLVDLLFNPLLTMIQADGRIRRYYLVSSAVSICGFALSWLFFASGADAYVSYLACIAVYLLIDIYKLLYAKKFCGFPVKHFLQSTLLPLAVTAVLSTLPPLACYLAMPPGILRSVTLCILSPLSVCLSAYLIALTKGEREFCFRKISRFLPDKWFLQHEYTRFFGEKLDWRRPQGLNAKIQWLKLYDRKPLYHRMADKQEAKGYVAERIGASHIIPTLAVWDNAQEIDISGLPDRFVLKCTHDSGSVRICREKAGFDLEGARQWFENALRVPFHQRGREWSYKGIRPRIIAEPFLDGGPGGLTDYKFFCFDGKPAYLYVSHGLEDHSTARISFLTMDWQPAPFQRADYRPFDPLPDKPAGFEEMKRLAGLLSEGMRFLRVDFYQHDGQVYFSELTFYPCGGFMPFLTREQDILAGQYLRING